MIGLALSGGGSRAIAFHLGCLRALNDLEILDQVGALSTISGGSVIGAYYAYTPDKSFDEFEKDIRKILSEGFHRRIALELFTPTNLVPCFVAATITWLHEVVRLINKREWCFQRKPSRTDMFVNVLQRDVFKNLVMNSPRRNNLEIVIGSCELRTGSAFRFGNNRSGGWRQGDMIDGNVSVAFAVVASAAYPILLPALDRKIRFSKNGKEKKHRVFLTDGGVYDNLGIQVLEPGRNPEISLHTFPCEYLISCNAGGGISAGESVPMAFISRVTRSFEIVHRRVQDATMGRMHSLKEAGLIKDFALPYLGQLDNQLPWKPGVLIPREEVIDYPINFAPMSEEWINKLSARGEQLTRSLASYYLRNLLKKE